MNKAIALVKLIRPVNCSMVGVAVLVGAALAADQLAFQQPDNLAFGFLTGFLLIGAVMAINDYADKEIDAINEPTRPIPSGELKPGEALIVFFVFTIVGIILAVLTNLQSLVLSLFAWAISILYVVKGKRVGLLGNLMVSTCVAIPFIYGGFVVERGLSPASIIFAAIIFLSNTAREIIKGIVDIPGDKRSNVQTIAVLHGESQAAKLSSIFTFTAILLTPLPWLLHVVSIWFLPIVALTDIGLAWASISLLLKPSRENARRVKNRNLFWFLIGLLAFIIGIFS